MGDREKDQSYALAQLRPDQLAGLILPLGELSKAQTRSEAKRLGLGVAAKLDSQDICFVEGGDYRELLGVPAGAGAVVTEQGERVGNHTGIEGFTVGQRRGLPATHFNDGPRYVTRLDPRSNTVVIGREHELDSFGLYADDVNLIRPEYFAAGPVRVRAMTRYRAPLNPARATFEPGEKRLQLTFETPERAVAPGQLVAMYAPDGDEVLGAGTIASAF